MQFSEELKIIDNVVEIKIFGLVFTFTTFVAMVKFALKGNKNIHRVTTSKVRKFKSILAHNSFFGISKQNAKKAQLKFAR